MRDVTTLYTHYTLLMLANIGSDINTFLTGMFIVVCRHAKETSSLFWCVFIGVLLTI